MQFTGWLGAPSDQNAFLAWMRQSMDGHFLFKEQFTTEPHRRAFVRPLWLVLGKIASTFRAPPVMVYHLARLLAGFLLLLTIYRFVSLFFKSRYLRKTGFLLASVSAGLGWIFAVRTYLTGKDLYNSVDLLAPEAITFRSLHVHVHFAVSILLMLWIFILMIGAIEKNRSRNAWSAGVLGLVLAFEHPYDIITIYVTLSVFVTALLLMRKPEAFRACRMSLVLVVLSAGPMLYNYYFLQSDPVFRGWADQNIVLSPPPLGFLAGYGLVLLLALIVIPGCIRLKGTRGLLLLSWLAAIATLIYSPFSFQLKFIQGGEIALGVLATIGLFSVLGFTRQLGSKEAGLGKRARTGMVGLVVAFTLPTNLVALGNDMFFHRHREPFPVYLPVTVVDAFDWLRTHTGREEIVLCTALTGNFIPGRSGNRVYLGHWSETVRLKEKESEVRRFFQSMDNRERDDFINKERISYLFYGPDERALGSFNPFQWTQLSSVYRNRDVTIFRVRGSRSGDAGKPLCSALHIDAREDIRTQAVRWLGSHVSAGSAILPTGRYGMPRLPSATGPHSDRGGDDSFLAVPSNIGPLR